MVTLIILFSILSLFVLFLIFYKFIFLRDPKREYLEGDNIVAPADGKIINIMNIDKKNVRIRKGFLGKVNTLCSDVITEGYLISIFMSVFDVHVNRAPIDGEILSVKHKKGKFFMAFDIEKSFLNESNEIILKTKIGKIKVIQIAGFLARRIQSFVKPKQKVNKAERIGRIVLGSQVSLILPKNVRLLVNVGDRVKAGETLIAKNV
ncbi:MAG: phosphatidylserine decarboxylase [Nanoarchaeota archaeon]|nr:phosphatidylserine decarboxylase [Nanoarchaeota archaeon]